MLCIKTTFGHKLYKNSVRTKSIYLHLYFIMNTSRKH